ncbi:uncharacterized protein LOC134965025 isoform X2 [Pseudophryne corroboree]|uniref:uncharacterized protein LOC134965025 isoform X2 n=1 Tax=Pseudophryne corroboree TaxID=495146 RepID=UPI003081E5D4
MVTAMTPGLLLLTAVLAVWMDPAVGRIELSPPRPWINGSVTFIVTGVQGSIRFLDWYRGSDTNADNQIFRLQEGFPTIQGRRYFKEAIGFTNGSMQIVNLQKDFEGPYTVEIQADDLLQYTAHLTVLENSRQRHQVHEEYAEVEIPGERKEDTNPTVSTQMVVQHMKQSLKYQNKLATVMERIEKTLVKVTDALNDLTGSVKELNSQQNKHSTK